MSSVTTREYVSILRDLVRQGRTVSMRVAGHSMEPFLIHERDGITFRAPDRKLRRGDMVFYERPGGSFVMHRIIKVHKAVSKDGTGGGEDCTFDIAGDNQTVIEYGVRRDQIFALITEVKRKGKTLGPGSFWWDFFEKAWPRLIPLRRLLQLAYSLIARLRRPEDTAEAQDARETGENRQAQI